MDARTLETLADDPLPPRIPGGGNSFTDFAGGGYFYLDDRDRAVIPTTTATVRRRARPDGSASSSSATTTSRPAVRSATRSSRRCPTGPGGSGSSSQAGWSGRSIRERHGRPAAARADHELVRGRRDRRRLHRHRRRAVPASRPADGTPEVTWRAAYENIGDREAGPGERGLGHDADADGRDLVAITDNADPMNVVVYRARHGLGGEVCAQPVFEQGASATDNSLIAPGARSSSRTTTATPARRPTRAAAPPRRGSSGSTSTPDGTGCPRSGAATRSRRRWCRSCRSATGLVSLHEGPPRTTPDAWYLTAMDFRTGQTVYKRLPARGSASTTTTRRSRWARTAPRTSGCSAAWSACATRSRRRAPGGAAERPRAKRRHGSLQLEVRGRAQGRPRAALGWSGAASGRSAVTSVPRPRQAVRVDRRRPFRA